MHNRAAIISLFILLSGLLVTYQTWNLARQDIERIQREKFDFRVNEIVANIQTRLKSYEQVLLGASGLFAASSSVERAEFRSYVGKLELEKNFPGIQGVGFSRLIPSGDRERHIAEIRREGFPNYTHRPAGERDIYSAIVYLEPFDWRNQRAFGFDMYSEEVRRTAMRRAWEEGKTTISGKVKLVQETSKDVQSGFLMYVPVYRNGSGVGSGEGRRVNLVGWTYAPFRMNDLMKGILGRQYGEIQAVVDLEIYDGDALNPEALMYDSSASEDGSKTAGALSGSRSIDFGIHRWTVAVRSLPQFEMQETRNRLRSIGLAGIAISLLASLSAWLLLTGRARAMALAENMAAKLGESESRSHAVLENVMDGIITITESGIVQSFNPAAERIFGFAAADVIGNNVKMLMPEPYHAEHDGYLNNYCSSGIKKIIGIGREVVGKRSDGTTFPMDLAVSEFHLGEERLFTGIVRDITERKQAEENLDNLHRELRLLLESTGEGIYGIDVRGCCTFINGAAAHALGYSVDEMLGRNVHDLVHYRHVDGTPYPVDDCPIFQALRRGESRRVADEVFWRKDGKAIPVEYASYPIRDGDSITGAVITFSDITERLEAIQEINRFKNILDNTLDMIFMFDPESFRFVYLNKGIIETLGYARDELLGASVWEIMPLLPEHVFRSHVSPLLYGDKPLLNYETLHRGKDGRELPVEVFLQLVEDQGGKRLFVAISRDLTERRKVDKLKSEFVSTVSHELRTPLTSIRGSLGLIRGGVAGELPAQAKQMVEIAYNNAERLVRLINDILDMEKIESGKMRFDLQLLELMPLVEQALEANRAYGETYRVRFILAEGVPAVKVRVDADRFAQVMANLLSNAAKFSPLDDDVVVTVREADTRVRVEVADHGGGIPKEFHERIFQKFSQADSSDTKQKSGTGLGLSISKAIIEKFGGIIGFECSEGHGSTFYFELPPSGLEGAGFFREHDALSPRILICEDSPDVAVQLQEMLERRGYSADIAGSAEEAKVLIQRNHYSAMTLDITLPGQDGLSLLRDLQADKKTAGLPALVISAKAHEEQAKVGKNTPVLEWLNKPVQPEQVFAILRKLTELERRHPVVLHVEDDPDIRAIIRALIGEKGEVVTANTVAAGKALLNARNFDLIILDVGLSDGSGLELLPQVSARPQKPPVMVFSAHELSDKMVAGMNVALVKSRTSNQQLLDTIMNLLGKHE